MGPTGTVKRLHPRRPGPGKRGTRALGRRGLRRVYAGPPLPLDVGMVRPLAPVEESERIRAGRRPRKARHVRVRPGREVYSRDETDCRRPGFAATLPEDAQAAPLRGIDAD